MQGIPIKFNPIVRLLTFSDAFIWGSYHMMNALIAIYLQEKFGEGAVGIISIGFAIYLISRSILQIPIAEVLDKHKSYIDETIVISMSCFLVGICIYMLIFVSEPWHVYLIQTFFGLAIALNLPAWRKTMARFIDKGYEATEYTIYDIINSLFIAILTAIGGYIVSSYGGFIALFIVAGSISITGSFITLYLLKNKRIQHEYK